MRRSVVIVLAVLGVLVVILGVVVASIGTQFDDVRLERDDLQAQVMDLEQDVDATTEERNSLQQRLDEQVKTIEQLKAELERTRSQPQAAPAAR